MTKVYQLSIVCVFLIFSACRNATSDTPDLADIQTSVPAVTMLANDELRYMELEGTPYERGLTHGRMLKKEIHEVISRVKEDIVKNTQQDPAEFIADFLELTSYQESIQTVMPELLEEIRGISDGSGVDLPTIFFHQLGDEYWNLAKDMVAHSCSSFGVDKSESGPSIAAQNMDIPTFFHGYQTVVKIMDVDKELMLLTIPGHLGITGMNNKAVSINCNTLSQLDYGKTGLPVTYVVRGVLSKNNQTEALQFLKDIKHASGQNYIIGGQDRVYSMECSANKISEFRPFENASFTYHTNHPMSNDDYNNGYLKKLQEQHKTTEEGLYQCQRIKSFEKRFNVDTETVEIAQIKEVLRSTDNAGYDDVSNGSTYASVIYVLSDHPTFMIAPGKPDEHEYIDLTFVQN